MNLPRKIYRLWRKRYRKRKYREYLRSDKWLNFRRKILKQRNRCKKCGSKDNLQVHHRHYKNGRGSILGRERSRDVEVLCERCHEREHK